MSEIIQAGKEIYGMTNSGHMVSMGEAKALGWDYNSAAASNTKNSVTKKVSEDSDKWVSWGDDNLFPQNRKRLISSNTIIPTTLQKLANMLISGGLNYGRIDVNEKGEEEFHNEKNDAVEEFLRRSMFHTHYLPEAALDYYTWKNFFPMLQMSNDGKQVMRIINQSAENCRFGKMNSKGVIEKCYLADWENDGVKLPLSVLNKWDDNLDELKGENYIYPMNSIHSANPYYSIAEWETLVKSGWLEVSAAIPKFKKALMRNQITPKYNNVISTWFWEEKYKDWHTKNEKEQLRLKKLEQKNFDEMMSGVDNAGKSIMSFKKMVQGVEEEAWEVKTIGDKIQNGIYIEDSQECSSQIYYAMGADPSLFGSAPGTTKSGSGSDKEKAYNIHMIQTKPIQNKLLEPLNNFIAEYNGWKTQDDKPMQFWFRDYQLARQKDVTPKDRL